MFKGLPLRAMIAVLVVAGFQYASAKNDYDIVWNLRKMLSQSLESEPTMVHNDFNGAVVTTLYNHPGSIVIGDWPCYYDNGTVASNGGLPQQGNLTKHLLQVEADIERLFPDPNHAGYIVIDWEVWEPWLNPHATTIYANKSFELAGGDIAAAVAAWNASSLKFMAETLKVAVKARPLAKWGYYGVIGCDGGWDITLGTCEDLVTTRNDALQELWAAGTALYPSIYSSCKYTAGANPKCLPDTSEENATVATKIAITLGEVNRINIHQLPVMAYTWYTLYTHQCATGPPNGLGHCPLMRNPADLDAEFALARRLGATDGIIIWGSNGDVRPGTDDCAEFGTYLDSTLGPLLKGLASPP
eukprot:gene7066-13143_t